jgi:pyruvate dehydrogenase E2 component (dihydrolipoamide acetyltransferase)
MAIEVIKVPDLGGAENVDVIEVLVKPGDGVTAEQSLVVVESEKASMEVPCPKAGQVMSIKVKVGDKVSAGHALIELEVSASVGAIHESPLQNKIEPAALVEAGAKPAQVVAQLPLQNTAGIYAGPAVRKLARELGINLAEVKATGPRGRLQKDDVHSYIRTALEKARSSGGALPKVPDIDFSKFGEINLEPMSKIARITADNMQRSWLNVPHVTQFDDADLTQLDALRHSLKAESEKRDVKLTPLAFLLKTSAIALKAHPKFNSSLHNDGKHFVRKQYIHLGLAVDTPAGLMVPVLRDVDKKDIWQIAQEVIDLSSRARDGKLKPAEMQGGCFTISSLGAIGGKGFTPVVNVPEVAILGVSKSQIKPVWDGKQFVAKNMLPLCLSYDHRAVNGADAGRFMTYLVEVISKINEHM